MWRAMMIGLTLSVLVLTALSQAGDAKKSKVEGTWIVKSVTINGKKSKEDLKNSKLVISGNKYTLNIGGKEEGHGTFKVDTSKKPHTIDIMAVSPKGKKATIIGIFKIEDNTMTVCAVPSGKERPDTFACPPGSQRQLVVYERQKKTKKK